MHQVSSWYSYDFCSCPSSTHSAYSDVLAAATTQTRAWSATAAITVTAVEFAIAVQLRRYFCYCSYYAPRTASGYKHSTDTVCTALTVYADAHTVAYKLHWRAAAQLLLLVLLLLLLYVIHATVRKAPVTLLIVSATASAHIMHQH
jgi:hypothetical protein